MFARQGIAVYLLLIGCRVWANESEDKNYAVTPNDDTTLLVSTLGGALYALDSNTGDILWKQEDEPVVKSPYDPEKPVMPAFLPDPKDGSLYMMGGSVTDPLKKLPFTIPQLVAGSPSKSAEGILYSGKKVDTWFSVDRRTGHKHGALNYQGCIMGEINTCPITSPGSILIGRTEYNLMMFDTRTENRKWNITYYDYTANMANRDVLQDYEHAHFVDSSTGILLTMDRKTGQVEWETDLESPVVGMYLVQHDTMYPVPFRSVSIETLENLLTIESDGGKLGDTKLFPTLYIGEHAHGLFAVPCLVDQQTITISHNKNHPLLLEGNISDKNSDSSSNEQKMEGNNLGEKFPADDYSALIVLGHYSLPESREETDYSHLQITDDNILGVHDNGLGGIKLITAVNQTQIELEEKELVFARNYDQLISFNITFIMSSEFTEFMIQGVVPRTKRNIMQIENKELKLIAVVVCLTLAWFVRFVKTKFDALESNSLFRSYSNSLSKVSNGSGSAYDVTAVPVELSTGEVKVGNITFDPTKVLGKGCEGTFVYQGRFDNRNVAVKRVLAACFSIADREVDLLRESDEHPNVIRYFCMEQCRQFRYIALELCAATLQDYVEEKYINKFLDPTVIFKQSVQGLAHLHSLDIAHRDIKPQNVLLSVTSSGGVRAMISDFGLCKKLKLGRMSFSQRSGVAGTEGWIAAEMLLEHQSTTCMVDVFSLGCVYYYILTRGKHPFGDAFHRQANILSGRWDLSLLESDTKNTAVIQLLEKMLSFEPSERPPASAILKHPVFWNKEKVLGFLQDVSDRVDKEEEGSVVLLRLERGADLVFQGEWYQYLDPVIRADLRTQRSYRNTLKDLLRALRNKKHHFRELTDQVKTIYGSMPEGFINFWISRFPNLLSYVYTSMHCVKYEPDFSKYYHKDFDFIKARRSIDTLDSGIPKTNLQRDLFDSNRSQSSRLSNNSLISNWENIDSSKLVIKPQDSRDDGEMLPCYRFNPGDNPADNPRFNPNYNPGDQDKDQSLLRQLAQMEQNEQMKLNKVRKPAEEKVKEVQKPQGPLNFAKAVTGSTNDIPSPIKLTNDSSSPTKTANDSLFPPLSPRRPTNKSPSKRESTNSSPSKTSSMHKSSTEPVLRHIPSDDTITQRVQSEPALVICPNVDNTIVNESDVNDLSDNKSDSNANDHNHQDFRTIDNAIIESDIKDTELTSIDNDSITDNKTIKIETFIDNKIENVHEEDGNMEKKDATKKPTADTTDCDNNDDENNDEEDKKGGKRVRKRRKHQKKPHVPRFIGIEECLAD